MPRSNIPQSYDRKDYLSLMSSPSMSVLAEEMRMDGVEDAGLFFARELDHIKSQTYDVQYPEFTALQLFAVSSEVNIGATHIEFHTYDKTGSAKIITDYADDLPRADVVGKPTRRPIKVLGTHYGYSTDEMRASRMAGKSLDIRRAEAAKYASDYLTNRIAWAGDTENDLHGVLSPSNDVPIFTLPTNQAGTSTKFVDKTPQEQLADISAMVRFVSSLTKSVERPDTLALPTDAYLHLFDTPRSDASDLSVGEWILKNVPRLKAIVEAPELNADSGITPYPGIGCGFLFSRNPRKFTIEIPMPFYQHPVQQRNLAFVIPCECKIGGAVIYYPLSMLIIPGV